MKVPSTPPPFAELVGIEFVEAGEGRAVFALDAGMTECEITDAEGRLIAKASSTLMTLRGELAAGR